MYKLYQVEAKSDQVPVARSHADKHNPKLQPVCAKHHTPNFAFLHTTPSRQFRWLAQPHLHGLFVGEVLVFLLFKGK
jgi:hypothetical protein